MKVAVLGEILWDMVGEARYLGGAPLNFAFHMRALGHEPLLISAVGNDELGSAATREIEARGLSTRFVGQVNGQPTGTVTVSMGEHGVPEYAIHRPAAYDFPSLSQDVERELVKSAPQWIYLAPCSR